MGKLFHSNPEMDDVMGGEDLDLLPCPFCANLEIHIVPDEQGSGGQDVPPYHVVCGGAGCGASVVASEFSGAVELWNTRLSQP